MDIKEITAKNRPISDIISDLKAKTIKVPEWAVLQKEYDPRLHPVMKDPSYRDKVVKGQIVKMSRITFAWQRLATNRMAGLIFGIPVKRVYKPKNDAEKVAGQIMESIFKKNRIDSMNLERGKNLFASCENVTIWYTQEQPTSYAGYDTRLKLRCKNFTPMKDCNIFPLFDEYDDLIALSLEYSRAEGTKSILYFDTYTKDEHIRWRTSSGDNKEVLREKIGIGKIPGVYLYRDTPIWEDESNNVYESEWTMSRSGNYIRKNARPTWVEFTNNAVQHGKEPAGNSEDRNILRYGQDDKAGYVTWNQANESIKFYTDEIKRNFFMDLQLPDMSMENMKTTPMSGEARKMVFIDCQMKVLDEAGRWQEAFDREVNIIRAFAKKMFPQYEKAFDTVQVDIVITPFQIKDESERTKNITDATGGKQIMSQRTGIAQLGKVDDVDAELKQIQEEQAQETNNLFNEPTE